MTYVRYIQTFDEEGQPSGWKTITNKIDNPLLRALIDKPLRVPPKTKCTACGRFLHAIGLARKNGKAHSDWSGRTMHKSCFKRSNSH